MVTEAQIRRIFERLVRPLRGRVEGMVRRATLAALKSGAGQSGTITTTASDADDDVEIFEPYGFTSAPVAGAEGVALRVGAERAGTILVCIGDRSKRYTGLAAGEVAMYHPNGTRVVLRTTGMIEVTPGPGGKVKLGGPAATLAVARQTDPVAVSSAALLTLKQAINAWVPVPNDGGAALKTALASFTGMSDAAVAAGTGTITGGGAGAAST